VLRGQQKLRGGVVVRLARSVFQARPQVQQAHQALPRFPVQKRIAPHILGGERQELVLRFVAREVDQRLRRRGDVHARSDPEVESGVVVGRAQRAERVLAARLREEVGGDGVVRARVAVGRDGEKPGARFLLARGRVAETAAAARVVLPLHQAAQLVLPLRAQRLQQRVRNCAPPVGHGEHAARRSAGVGRAISAGR
jgi:hypothetical protein